MNKQNSKTISMLNREEEDTIRAIVEKTSERINQTLVQSMIELISKLRETRMQPANQRGGSSGRDEFLKAADVAKILKISKAQAYHLIKTRAIASFSIGRTVRVRREDLDAFIQLYMIR